MSTLLYRLGSWSARHGWRVVLSWLLLVVAVTAVARAAGGELSDDISIPGTETQQAVDLLNERFSAFAGGSATIVFHVEEGVADPAAVPSIEATLERIRALPHVVAVSNPLAPESTAQVSADGTIAYADVRYDIPAIEVGADGLDALIAALEPANDAGIQVEAGGEVPSSNTEVENSGTEIFGIGMAIVILLVAFGSVIAMGLPIGVAIACLAVGLAAVDLVAGLTNISTVAPIVATMIGLGVGIDYALFIVTRFRENLRGGMSVEAAVGRANATAGQAVLFAGGTVVIAILGLMLTGITLVGSLGLAAAIVVLFAVAAALSLLPALLGLIGRRIDRFALRLPRRLRHQDTAPRDGFWVRWSRRVSGRPWPWFAGSALLLLLLAAPVLDLELGQPDAGNEPSSTTHRRAYDLLADGFGVGFNGPLSLIVTLPEEGGLDDPTNAALLDDVAAAVAADPDVDSVGDPVPSPDGGVAILTAIPRTAPQDTETEALVRRLRADVLDPIVARAPDGAEALVAGPTAAFIDIAYRLEQSLPVFMGAVMALSILLLTVVFRSIVLALKAAVLNLLSIGASYGVVVAVFQWGWGLSLLGISEPVPIVSFIPILMFAIVFGLSMDYEVFLLSRIREEYLKSGDTLGSVSHGLAGTARVITAAALIMISVFGAFATAPSPVVKMLGLGMATAVLIDATIVRLILVPAVMSLLGRANWWLPSWLDRRLPHLDLEGGPALHPAPDPTETPA